MPGKEILRQAKSGKQGQRGHVVAGEVSDAHWDALEGCRAKAKKDGQILSNVAFLEGSIEELAEAMDVEMETDESTEVE